jgi:hypothetical protein
MTVTFRCGHATTLPDTYAAAPSCPTCREMVVSRVTVRPPSFTGTVRGPFASYQDLGPLAVDLKVKESDHG